MITKKNSIMLWGAPPNWTPPQIPPNWKPDKVKVTEGESPIDKDNNPGRWSPYSYQAVYSEQNKQYLHHAMPLGATVVPKDPITGKCEPEGYEFFYNGWSHPNPNKSNHCLGASKENLFPEDRELLLDNIKLGCFDL